MYILESICDKLSGWDKRKKHSYLYEKR
jgi:hypothetical protein